VPIAAKAASGPNSRPKGAKTHGSGLHAMFLHAMIARNKSATVTSPLRILLLEDDATDAELILELLQADRFVCEATRVQTRAEFLAALENRGLDLILADYRLRSFDGLSALKLALAARPDLPFIFVSGTLGEELAIEAVKLGATDYVLKTRLSRLVPSVQRALREARERAERQKAEEAAGLSERELFEVIEAMPMIAFTTLSVGHRLEMPIHLS
jgi:DNA-binding NtrC family response regulator